MKTIGLIGGITWYSTLDYYRLLNEMVNEKLGGAHSAKIILNSLEFAIIRELTEKLDWDGLAKIMCTAARGIETAGAGCLLIGANTMHNIADEVQAAINIPVIHIADAVADSIQQKQLKKVALLGTRYTMQLDFYKDKLLKKGIGVIIPSAGDIEFINHAIYNEFGKGLFGAETKQKFLTILDTLIGEGAQGAVFGCTEIPILLKQEDCPVPVFDTTLIHVAAAVEFALNG